MPQTVSQIAVTVSRLKIFLTIKGILHVMARFVVDQLQWQALLGGFNRTIIVLRQTLPEIFGATDVEFSVSF